MDFANIQSFIAVLAALSGGVVVHLANIYFNSRNLSLNATNTAIDSLREALEQLRIENTKKDDTIHELELKISDLENQINRLRKEVEKH